MKTMTCQQLGGPCNIPFHANSFEEIAALSKRHAMEMFQKNDQDHLKAMNDMQDLMKTPDDIKQWLDLKKQEFEALPEDKQNMYFRY